VHVASTALLLIAKPAWAPAEAVCHMAGSPCELEEGASRGASRACVVRHALVNCPRLRVTVWASRCSPPPVLYDQVTAPSLEPISRADRRAPCTCGVFPIDTDAIASTVRAIAPAPAAHTRIRPVRLARNPA
jgi:hypothetical protein